MKTNDKPSRPSSLVTLSRLTLLTVLVVQADGITPSTQAQDKFDGAVWRFTMTPKTGGLKKLKGQFRVSNNRLFQKSKQDSTDFDKLVGTNNPKGKKTVITLTDLRAVDKKKNWHNGIKGKVRLTMDRFGQWRGRLIDSQGRHWDFACTRFQE